MLAASTSYPFFDPADFASSSSSTPSPSTMSTASSTSSMASQRWVDAHASPYSSCGQLAAAASSSQTSLWTASSTTSDDEQRCLDLLDQLEDEVTKLGDRTSPVKPTRSAPFPREQAAAPSSSRMAARAVVASSSTSTLRPSHPRRSRRLSFTKTDLADLDIDAILEAYSNDGALPPIETAAPPARPARSQLRAAKSAVSLRAPRTNVFPAERAFPRPPQVTEQNLELHRTATDQSARSAHSSVATTTAGAYDNLFPHRRVAPFPTMERKKSSTSMRSMATRRPSAADAPPLPPMPAAHFSSSPYPSEHGSPAPSIRSNRTFSSFARQSTCSNASSLASFASSPSSSSSPNPPSSSAPRSHVMRSTLSRDSHYSTASSSAASSSEANSFRWSVATSSTAPSDTDTASSSRRGSAGPPLPHGAGAAARSGGKGRRFAAGAPREDDEDDVERALEADLPASRRRALIGAHPAQHDDDSDAERDHGGLISWEDFASELEALAPPPPAPAPASARRAGAFPPQQQQQQTLNAMPSTASLKAGREGRASRMRKISLATLRAR
ncbi:hypothetical protein JCM9279_000324 [Rhodotorula babjevae]